MMRVFFSSKLCNAFSGIWWNYDILAFCQVTKLINVFTLKPCVNLYWPSLPRNIKNKSIGLLLHDSLMSGIYTFKLNSPLQHLGLSIMTFAPISKSRNTQYTCFQCKKSVWLMAIVINVWCLDNWDTEKLRYSCTFDKDISLITYAYCACREEFQVTQSIHVRSFEHVVDLK